MLGARKWPQTAAPDQPPQNARQGRVEEARWAEHVRAKGADASATPRTTSMVTGTHQRHGQGLRCSQPCGAPADKVLASRGAPSATTPILQSCHAHRRAKHGYRFQVSRVFTLRLRLLAVVTP